MKIPKDKIINSNFYVDSSMENLVIDDLELDLASKPNVFKNVPVVNTVPIESEKKTNPIKRLNTFDNHFLQNGEDLTGAYKTDELKKYIVKSDFDKLVNSMNNVFNGILVKIPVINYFVLKKKQNKLKESIKSLNSINNDVDELINLSVPYGEQSEKYRVLSENLMKANNINSQIRKGIKD